MWCCPWKTVHGEPPGLGLRSLLNPSPPTLGLDFLQTALRSSSRHCPHQGGSPQRAMAGSRLPTEGPSSLSKTQHPGLPWPMTTLVLCRDLGQEGVQERAPWRCLFPPETPFSPAGGQLPSPTPLVTLSLGVGCSYESRAGSFGTPVRSPHPALVLEDPIPEMSAQVLPLGVTPFW